MSAIETTNQESHQTPQNDVDRLIGGFKDALTDTMVERMAETAGSALEIVDRLNDPDTRAAVHTLIDRVTDLHRTGAMDTLYESALLIHAMRSAATDNIVERITIFLEHLFDTFDDEELIRHFRNLSGALEEAANAANETQPKGGLFEMLALIRSPESQQNLMFLLKLGEALRESSSTR